MIPKRNTEEILELILNDESQDIFGVEASDGATKGSKNPKGSARQKYNRRKVWLAHALDQMEIAIDTVLSQDGPVYKRQEIDDLREAIAVFREATGLKAPEMAPLTQEEMDGFTDMLSNLKPWEPPSKEELAGIYALLGKVPDSDDAGDEAAGTIETDSDR